MGAPEDEIRIRVYQALRYLFPRLENPDIAVELATGNGDADVVCRNLVVETKKRGVLGVHRRQTDPTAESPQAQLERYLNALSSSPRLIGAAREDWRGLVTDGTRWEFYRYYPDRVAGSRLDPDAPDAVIEIERTSEIDALLFRLRDAVDRSAKLAPPSRDGKWATDRLRYFEDLAERVQSSSSFGVKLDLWKNMLEGAFINAPSSAPETLRLFASHTLLVLTARAVGEAVAPPLDLRKEPSEAKHIELSRGFPSWLIDSAGEEGVGLIEDLREDVTRYDWRRSEHDYLKDLYHAIIPKQVRHDFGEYYTPDWLARAVCEEVLDPEWREQVVDEVVAGNRSGPAVLDPACGSGTFVYHATRLLLESAGKHPELMHSPFEQAQVANMLVAGIDLHPVAVELAQTTKRLAFAGLGDIPELDSLNVFMGDSLRWSMKSKAGLTFDDLLVSIPVGDEEPIRLPRSLVLSEDFPLDVKKIFEKVLLDDPNAETALLSVLGQRSKTETECIKAAFRRFREFHQSGRNHIWQWYIQNLAEPYRLSAGTITRLVGNPPWVVYNKIDVSRSTARQDALRSHSQDRRLWAAGNLAPHNDLAAVFVATCVDEYLAEKWGGAKFGFVLPHAALRARQWARFRSGEWTSITSDRTCNVDLGHAAWDLTGVQPPPFPHAAASVVFGEKIGSGAASSRSERLSTIHSVVGDGIDGKSPWRDVERRIEFKPAPSWATSPSHAYAYRFRQGATLVPQSLVVFSPDDEHDSLGNSVGFTTQPAKEGWNALRRTGTVEKRFVLEAVFSKHVVPFGTKGRLNVLAPVAPNRRELLPGLPDGRGTRQFRDYWDSADSDYRRKRRPKSPETLLGQIDFRGKLSARLKHISEPCVVFTTSGSWLTSAVVPGGAIIDSTLYWALSDDENELHYLAAIFNAPALAQFFREAGRRSDRHFHTGPITCLPIPAFDKADYLHAQLARHSRRAHDHVAKGELRTRKKILEDGGLRPHLDAIDACVREMIPDYVS